MLNFVENVSPPSAIKPTETRIHVDRYSGITRILHWLIAALVLATWPLGFVIDFVKNGSAMTFYMLHEGFGFTVLWLMLLRVGNKLISRSPQSDEPRAIQIAAHSVHGLLYLFLIIMPVSGFLATNAHGFPYKWFGLIDVWSPISKSPDIAWTLSGIHFWSSWILLALFILHIGAVLMHHVIKRDVTLYKIL